MWKETEKKNRRGEEGRRRKAEKPGEGEETAARSPVGGPEEVTLRELHGKARSM